MRPFSMNPADRVRLQHMRDAVELAARFIDGRLRGDLDTDPMLLFALVRAIEIIGEAAARVSEGTRAGIEIPWTAVVGMRNRLIHAYFDVDKDILWATAVQSLPALGNALRQALDSSSGL